MKYRIIIFTALAISCSDITSIDSHPSSDARPLCEQTFSGRFVGNATQGRWTRNDDGQVVTQDISAVFIVEIGVISSDVALFRARAQAANTTSSISLFVNENIIATLNSFAISSQINAVAINELHKGTFVIKSHTAPEHGFMALDFWELEIECPEE